MDYYIVKQTELYHHGIKGMKWGVRRFQKKDGTLTPAGKKRYDEPNTSNENGQKVKKKSKHRLMLEEKYKAQGLSQKDAEKQAAARIKTEKILAVSAGVAVGACAAYIASKKLRDRIDGVIKAGENLQRVEMKDTGGKLHDVFYTSKGNHDNKRYEGLLGMTRHRQTGEAYLMKLQSNSDIKVASKDHAAKIFGELYKNDDNFRASVRDQVSKHFGGSNRLDPDNLSNRNIKKMYENFNSNLIHIRDSKSGADATFYNKLKKAGYGAIQDINDMKYSGYNAKNPLIVFGQSNNIMVKSVQKMSGKDVAVKGMKERTKARGEVAAEQMLKRYGVLTAGTLTVAATSSYITDYSNQPNNNPQVNL